MSQGDTPITIVGNLVTDPELRYTPSGAAVANFRVASTPRQYDKNTNQWVDGDALFLTCNVWRQQAENVANSLTKGMRIIVTGVLKQRNFEAKDGERRSVFEVEAAEVGPALKYATAQVTKTSPGNTGQARPQANNNSFGQQGAAPQNSAWDTNDQAPF